MNTRNKRPDYNRTAKPTRVDSRWRAELHAYEYALFRKDLANQALNNTVEPVSVRLV